VSFETFLSDRWQREGFCLVLCSKSPAHWPLARSLFEERQNGPAAPRVAKNLRLKMKTEIPFHHNCAR
jgi:hypothetical protein